MIVSQLQIYDFRRFKSIDGKPGLSITFHEGLNALIGENDSGKTGYIPTDIIIDDASIDKVVEKYILALDENELYDPNGFYKIIGAVKKRDLTGLKIGDYWSEYDDHNNLKSEYNYWNYVRAISEGLSAGKLYYAEGQFRRLPCKILHYAGVTSCRDCLCRYGLRL